MTSNITDRVYGESASVAVKAPCLSVSVGAPLPLVGLGAVGSYTPQPGDRILVKDQTDPTTNGIYNASAGAWARSGDFNGAYDAVQGTLIVVFFPNGQATMYQLTTANPVIGTTPLNFASFINPNQSYPQTAAEAANGVIPTIFAYPAGDARRYGADPTGVADSTAAINNALLCNSRVYLTGGTYQCSAPLLMQSGQTFYGDGAATILSFANSTLNNVVMNALTGSSLRDMKIIVTGGSSVATTGAVRLLNCTACSVSGVEMTGMWGFGVWIDCSNYCVIEENYAHAFNANATGNNFGDIGIYCTASTTTGASYNIIRHNRCYGLNNAFGISLQD